MRKKYINKFIKKPIRNVIGKMWVKHNLILRSPQKKKKVKDKTQYDQDDQDIEVEETLRLITT